MIKKSIKSSAVVLTGASILTGCMGLQETNKIIKEGDVATKTYNEKGSVLATNAASVTGNSNANSNFGRASKNWVDPIPLPKLEPKAELPSLFQKSISMTMPGTINAVEILSEMQRSTGVKFKISNDIYDTNSNVGQVLGVTAANSTGTVAKPILIPDFVFRGSLENALNLLASKANVSWKWNGSEVEIYRYESRSYTISALAGQTTTSANVTLSGNQGDGGGGGGGGSGSGASANAAGSTGAQQQASVQRQSKLTTWDEIKPFIVAQLTPNGKLAVLESTGVISVKDTPQAQERVKKAVEELNKSLTQQVYLNVEIFAIKSTNGDSFAFNPTALFSSNYLSLAVGGGPGQAIKNASTFNLGILSGPFTGSNFLMQALSTLGDTSLLNQFTITTLSGQPAPISSSVARGYVKSIEVNISGSNPTTITQSIEVDSAIEGVNMSITPKVEKNGNILVEYSLNINEILCLDVVGICAQEITSDPKAPPSKVSLPITQGKSFLQRAQMRSGQTLLVSGFKQKIGALNKQGVGSPYNPVLGGSSDAQASVQYVVVAITPSIASDNQNFQR